MQPGNMGKPVYQDPKNFLQRFMTAQSQKGYAVQ